VTKRRQPRFLVYLLVFLAVLVVDQATKAVVRVLAVGESIQVVPGVLWLTHAQNTGASFSMLTGSNILLLWFSLFVLGLLLYWHDQFTTVVEKTCYTLIFAGLVGNLTDRVLFGAVTDFFDLGWWPVFNIADSALVAGVLGLVAYELFRKKRAQQRLKTIGAKR